MYMNGMWKPGVLFFWNVHLGWFFFLFFETGALTGLELTKLSWLRSQQEVQIHMSPPSSTRTIVYETLSGRFPYHGFLGLASVPHALPSVLKAFQIGTILFKEKKPPCMPTSQCKKTPLTPIRHRHRAGHREGQQASVVLMKISYIKWVWEPS